MLRIVFDISRKEKFDEHPLNVGNAQEADVMFLEVRWPWSY